MAQDLRQDLGLASKLLHYYAVAKLRTFCSVASGNTRHIHAQPFNGPLSGTTRVSQYQKGKTNPDFTEARVAVASAGPYASLHCAPGR